MAEHVTAKAMTCSSVSSMQIQNVYGVSEQTGCLVGLVYNILQHRWQTTSTNPQKLQWVRRKEFSITR